MRNNRGQLRGRGFEPDSDPPIPQSALFNFATSINSKPRTLHSVRMFCCLWKNVVASFVLPLQENTLDETRFTSQTPASGNAVSQSTQTARYSVSTGWVHTPMSVDVAAQKTQKHGATTQLRTRTALVFHFHPSSSLSQFDDASSVKIVVGTVHMYIQTVEKGHARNKGWAQSTTQVLTVLTPPMPQPLDVPTFKC